MGSAKSTDMRWYQNIGGTVRLVWLNAFSERSCLILFSEVK
jgi:hypothetical protein